MSTQLDLKREYYALIRLHEDMVRRGAPNKSLVKVERQLHDAYDKYHLSLHGGTRCRDRAASAYLPSRQCDWCNNHK